MNSNQDAFDDMVIIALIAEAKEHTRQMIIRAAEAGARASDIQGFVNVLQMYETNGNSVGESNAESDGCGPSFTIGFDPALVTYPLGFKRLEGDDDDDDDYDDEDYASNPELQIFMTSIKFLTKKIELVIDRLDEMRSHSKEPAEPAGPTEPA